MSFETDIQGQNTQLYPIVTIEPPDMTGDWADRFNRCKFLSTNNVSLEHIHVNNGANSPIPTGAIHHFKPLLVNIPSIKQSIDIESRKFKISNVSLDISNYEYNGERFSDILSDTSLMNWKVSIQFVSPSANIFLLYMLLVKVVGMEQVFIKLIQGIMVALLSQVLQVALIILQVCNMVTVKEILN